MSKETFLAQYGSRKHIESALQSTDGIVRKHVMLNPGLTSDEIINQFKAKSEHPLMLLALLDNPNINDDHLRLAMHHPIWSSVQKAAKSKWKELHGEE